MFLRITDAETLTETGQADFQQRDRGLLHTDIVWSGVFKMDLERMRPMSTGVLNP